MNKSWKSIKKLLIVFLSILISSQSSNAGSVTYTSNINDIMGSLSAIHYIPGFNQSLGNLTSIEITFEHTVTSEVQFENTVFWGSQVGWNQSGYSYIHDGTGKILFSFNPTTFSGARNLSGYDGAVDFNGSSGFTYRSPNQSKIETITLTGFDMSRFQNLQTVMLVDSANYNQFPSGHYYCYTHLCIIRSTTIKVKYNYDSIPTCNAAPVSNSYQNLSCSNQRTTVTLDGRGSFDLDNNNNRVLPSFSWSTNCPNATLSSSTSPTPSLSFNSTDQIGASTSCTAYLTVSDSSSSVSCQATISVGGCPRDCNGVLFGQSRTDVCGICGGNGQSCLDCAGTPFGNAQRDQCGICKGDGKSCLDCAGIINGPNRVDSCGVCGGNGKSCIPDACNIIGGNGASCLDCAGVPFGTSKIDRCGICGGDGTSCLGCSNVNIEGTAISADHKAEAINRRILSLVKLGRQLTKKKGAFVSEKESGDNFFKSAWLSANGFGPTVQTCSNNSLCVTQASSTNKTSYIDSISALRNIAISLSNKILTGKKRVSKSNKKKINKILKEIEVLYSDGIKKINSIPNQSVCR